MQVILQKNKPNDNSHEKQRSRELHEIVWYACFLELSNILFIYLDCTDLMIML